MTTHIHVKRDEVKFKIYFNCSLRGAQAHPQSAAEYHQASVLSITTTLCFIPFIYLGALLSVTMLKFIKESPINEYKCVCVNFCVYSLCASFYVATSSASATSNLSKRRLYIENWCGYSCKIQKGGILCARVCPGTSIKAIFFCYLWTGHWAVLKFSYGIFV